MAYIPATVYIIELGFTYDYGLFSITEDEMDKSDGWEYTVFWNERGEVMRRWDAADSSATPIDIPRNWTYG